MSAKSYEEWLREQGITYPGLTGAKDDLSDSYDTMRDYAQQLLESSNKAAESAYQKSAVGANNRYLLYTGKYGNTAESLANRGLSNSGYAQYLTDRAYGRMIDEQLAARALESQSKNAARSAYDQTMMDITQREMTDMDKLEQGQKNAYSTLLQRVNSGEFNDFSQISQLGLGANLTSDQMETLYGAFVTSSDNKRTSAFETALNNINSGAYTSFEQVQQATAGSNLTPEQMGTLSSAFAKHSEEIERADLASKAQAAAARGDDATYLKYSISAGTMTRREASSYAKSAMLSAINDEDSKNLHLILEQYVKSGVMTAEDKSAVQEALYNDLRSSGRSLFSDANGDRLSQLEIDQLLDDIKNIGLLDTIQLENLRRASIDAVELSARDEEQQWVKGSNGQTSAAASGTAVNTVYVPSNNATATVRKQQGAISVQWNGGSMITTKAAGEDVSSAAKRAGLKNNSVFKYNGGYYAYVDGVAYEINPTASLKSASMKKIT